jgi:hypothetical protein
LQSQTAFHVALRLNKTSQKLFCVILNPGIATREPMIGWATQRFASTTERIPAPVAELGMGYVLLMTVSMQTICGTQLFRYQTLGCRGSSMHAELTSH